MTLRVDIQHRFAGFGLDARFEAPPGLTVLFGPSGSGKTTVMNAVAGVLKPDAGRVDLGGMALTDCATGVFVPPHRRNLGVVFQEGRLFPHLNVRQNLTYGRWFTRRRGQRDELGHVIEMLGIGPLLARRVAGLSGGEKQRVAIGRALLAAPELILADEPLAALDQARKAEILPYFERLRDEVAIPILYVSHAPTEVARLASHVVVMDAGRVAAAGTAAEILGDPMLTPLGARAAGAVLEARVVAHHPDGLSEIEAGGQALLLPKVPHAPGRVIRVRIAAQDVILAREAPDGLSALNILSGRIKAIRSGDGPGALVSLETPAGRILARITRRSVQALGLGESQNCYAILKSVAIAPEDISGREF